MLQFILNVNRVGVGALRKVEVLHAIITEEAKSIESALIMNLVAFEFPDQLSCGVVSTTIDTFYFAKFTILDFLRDIVTPLFIENRNDLMNVLGGFTPRKYFESQLLFTNHGIHVLQELFRNGANGVFGVPSQSEV